MSQSYFKINILTSVFSSASHSFDGAVSTKMDSPTCMEGTYDSYSFLVRSEAMANGEIDTLDFKRFRVHIN